MDPATIANAIEDARRDLIALASDMRDLRERLHLCAIGEVLGEACGDRTHAILAANLEHAEQMIFRAVWKLSPAANRPALPVNGKRNEG